MIRNTKHALAVVAILVLGAVGVASSGTEAIMQRQETMDSIQDALMDLAAIAKKEVPFDAGVVQKNAASIENHFREVSHLFPEGSGKGDVETWAKPEIWSDYDDFVLKLEAAKAQAEALKSVTEESAFRPALGKLGNACKSCHTVYRRPRH